MPHLKSALRIVRAWKLSMDIQHLHHSFLERGTELVPHFFIPLPPVHIPVKLFSWDLGHEDVGGTAAFHGLLIDPIRRMFSIPVDEMGRMGTVHLSEVPQSLNLSVCVWVRVQGGVFSHGVQRFGMSKVFFQPHLIFRLTILEHPLGFLQVVEEDEPGPT